MAFLAKCESFFRKVVDCFLGIAMFLLMVIVFIQVVSRYFLHMSIGGLEELPVYLMVASVWFAAASLCSTKGHISLDILPMLVHSKRVQAAIAVVTNLLSTCALAYLCYVMTLYMLKQKSDGIITPGLQMPTWWITLIIVFNLIVMVLFTLKNAFGELEAARHGNID